MYNRVLCILVHVLVDEIINNGQLDGSLLEGQNTKSDEQKISAEINNIVEEGEDLEDHIIEIVIGEIDIEDVEQIINKLEELGDDGNNKGKNYSNTDVNHQRLDSGLLQPDVLFNDEDISDDCQGNNGAVEQIREVQDSAQKTYGNTEFALLHFKTLLFIFYGGSAYNNITQFHILFKHKIEQLIMNDL